MARILRVLGVGLASVVLTACVKDDKVEDYLPPERGAAQPGKDGGGELTIQDACSQVVAALKDARDSNRCKAPADEDLVCPGYLAVAGSLTCDSVSENSVKACVARIGKYSSCSDFDTKACF